MCKTRYTPTRQAFCAVSSNLHCVNSKVHLVLLPEGLASLLQLGSLGQQVVLLQPNHRAWPAHTDVAYGLLRSEIMVLDEVAADEHPCSPQACLAVDG